MARWDRMIARALLCAGIAALALTLPGCERSPTNPTDTDARPAPASPATALPAPQWSPGTTSAGMAAPVLTPEADKGERGARNVLLEWARALERKDFARAAAQWGEGAAWTTEVHAKRFAAFGTITVKLGEGAIEGAAGSLYYAVPVEITGGPETLSGEIVVRRVNDVPGASERQLSWHIASLALAP